MVMVTSVGICGTDWEIHMGLYGEAPPGEERLILGHENLGRVAALGEGATGVEVGDYVVSTVRRPDDCANCQRGESDMCSAGGYRERGIKGIHGFMAEFYTERTEYLVKIPRELRGAAVLLEPLSVVEKALYQSMKIQERMVWSPKRALVLGAGPIGLLATALLRLRGVETYTLARRPATSPKARLVQEMGATYLDGMESPVPTLKDKLGNLDFIIEATGNSGVAFQAMSILGVNGVLCLTGVSGGNGTMEVPTDDINLQMVLGNKVVFGTVNANLRDFEKGVQHLGEIEGRWPALAERFFTHRYSLSQISEAFEASNSSDSIKVILDVSP
ncbi:MAG: Glucose dehydrogenase [Dehalococcoidia bacterium]|nr:Glucose dehydrogenase [Dehalococcoidia bacterium]